MNKLKNFLGMISGLIFGTAVFFSTPVYAEYAGDIKCTGKNTRFTVPGSCQNECKSGGLKMQMCVLSPQCSIIQNDKNLNRLYNQALFGRGMTGPVALKALASDVINRYFKPFNAKTVSVNLGHSPTKSADDTVPSGRFASAEMLNGKATLYLSEDLFLTSPGFLMTTIGHELIHLEQLKRVNNVNLSGLNRFRKSIRELEAMSWAMGKDSFAHSMGANPFKDCMRDQEKMAEQYQYDCNAWQVKQAIHDIVSSPRGAAYIPKLKSWLETDEWAKSVWLPQNQGWENMKRPTRPNDPDCTMV